jgi:hypothetical protein
MLLKLTTKYPIILTVIAAISKERVGDIKKNINKR